jgi:hypothetical protein
MSSSNTEPEAKALKALEVVTGQELDGEKAE